MSSKKVADMTPEEHEAHKARVRAYCAVNREKIRAQANALYHANKDWRAEQNKRYYEKHRAKKKATAAAWQKANQDKCREASRRFRERHPERRGEYYEKNREAVLAKQAEYRKSLSPERRAQAAVKKLATDRVWRERNADKVRAYQREYQRKRLASPENAKKNAERVAAYYEKHPEKKQASGRAYYEKNKEKFVKASENWRKKYPEKHAAKQNKRRAEKLQAMPSWANEFFISEAYDLARRRTETFGFPWHVDHIVPLKSRHVCGLHTEQNLQVIPGGQNLKKSNRVWPHMWESCHTSVLHI